MSSRVNSTASFARTRGSAPSAAPLSVRRNLFQSQLSRRPTGQAVAVSNLGPATASSSRPASYDMAEAGFNGDASASDPLSLVAEQGAAALDILVRDEHGEIELLDPPSPTPDDLSETALDERQEREREQKRLDSIIKYHEQRSNLPGQPEELLEAIRASLRLKVATLAEDNWIYDSEGSPRLE